MKCKACNAEMPTGGWTPDDGGAANHPVRCEKCRNRAAYRAQKLVFLCTLAVVTGTLISIVLTGGQNTGNLFFPAFVLSQWLVVIPHELGHAYSGRFAGFSNIRILIGSGKAWLNFDWLGFSW